jgi:hypothetical protein
MWPSVTLLPPPVLPWSISDNSRKRCSPAEAVGFEPTRHLPAPNDFQALTQAVRRSPARCSGRGQHERVIRPLSQANASVRWIGSRLGSQSAVVDLLIRSHRRSVQTGPWGSAALSLWPGRSWCVRSGPCHWVPGWVPWTFHRRGDIKPGLSFICLRHDMWLLAELLKTVVKIIDELDVLTCLYGDPGRALDLSADHPITSIFVTWAVSGLRRALVSSRRGFSTPERTRTRP